MAISREDKLRAVQRSFGAWRGLAVDGEQYVEQLRRGLRRVRSGTTPKASH